MQVTQAFKFDLVRLLGMALDTMADRWQKMNYSECIDFNTTDSQAYKQAEDLKEVIQNVCQMLSIYLYEHFVWRFFLLIELE